MLGVAFDAVFHGEQVVRRIDALLNDALLDDAPLNGVLLVDAPSFDAILAKNCDEFASQLVEAAVPLR